MIDFINEHRVELLEPAVCPDNMIATVFVGRRTIGCVALLLMMVACSSGSSSPATVVALDATVSADGQSDGSVLPDGGSTVDLDAGEDAGILPRPGPCEEGKPCNDGFDCTQNDTCVNGTCAGTEYQCDDGLACTRDYCDGKGGCAPELIAGTWCLIGGQCYGDGELNPNNGCEACVTPVTANSWSPNDGAACDDGLECTGNDMCAGGTCKGQKDAACDDNNPCTTNGCIEGQGCVHAAEQGPCEDGDFCSVGDKCNNKKCVAGPQKLDCDDGDQCTKDDCSADGGCSHSVFSGTCEDGDPCTDGDTCDLGECVSGPTKLCDDNNECTNDTCLPGKGCIHVPNLGPCDDENPCTENDTCSAGQCTAGGAELDCNDDDGCTNDICEPFKGCAHFPKAGSCDDGNPCTEDTKCIGGKCSGGTQSNCDDNDPCTDDICDPKFAGGCAHKNNTAPCEDGDACTEGDTCKNGVCQSNPKGCDDGNKCTVDYCDGANGCVHDLKPTGDCQIKIEFTSPKRASTLTGNKTITIKGKVTSPAGALVKATVNGKNVAVNSKGVFTTTLKAEHGMNLLEAYAEDALGNSDKAAQSFYFSTKYKAINPNSAMASSMNRAIYLYLSPEAVDDGNHSKNDADDLATIIELMVQALDIGSLIPNPAVDNSNYSVVINNVSYKPAKVQLVNINGGLNMYASIKTLKAKVKANGKCFLCPDASGNLSIDEIIISAELMIGANNGKAKVTMKNTDVQLLGLDVDVNGILGSLFDFIVDAVVNGFKPALIAEFKKVLGQQIPAALESALNSLAFNTDIDVGPFFEGGSKINASLSSSLETTVWTEDGGTLRLWGAATSPKKISTNALGVLRRDACMKGGTEVLDLSMDSALQVAISDDLLNAILYAGWYGGGLKFPLPSQFLGGVNLSQYGVDNLELEIEFLLPPVLTSCNEYDDLLLQMGDIKIYAKMTLLGAPVELNMYASAEAWVDLIADDSGLGITISDISEVVTDIVILNAALAGAEKTVGDLMADAAIPKLFELLTSASLAGFELPELDLGGLVDGIPEGTAIAIEPKTVDREKGWTVLSGAIK